MTIRKIIPVVPCALMLCASAIAQEFEKEVQPLTLTLGILQTNNVNPTLPPRESATRLSFAADGALASGTEGMDFRVGYFIRYADDKGLPAGQFDTSVLDAGLLASTRLYLRSNVFWDLSAGFRSEDEGYGRGISLARSEPVTAPDTRRDANFRSVLTLGTDKRQIQLAGHYKQTDYRSDNDYAELFDREDIGLTLSGQFLLSERTHLKAEWAIQQTDFNDVSRVDNRFNQLLVGASWQVSGKSGLDILAGYYRRTPEVGDPRSGLAWRIGYQYDANDNYRWWLNTERRNEAGVLTNAQLVTRSELQLGASRQLTQLWSISGSLSLAETDHQLADESVLLTSQEAKFALIWQPREQHKLALVAEYVNEERPAALRNLDSTQIGLRWSYVF